MNGEQKKHIAVAAFTGTKTITQIAKEIDTSRSFVREQKTMGVKAIDAVFNPEFTPDKVLFHIPVTQQWIEQLVLSLLLINVSYRYVSTLLNDVFDYTISIATINTVFNTAVKKAQQIHSTEDLSGIQVTANDAFFHRNKPILSGVDTRSLYCYLLSAEDRRDEDTWAIQFMDCQDKGLKPERTIGDDANGLVSGHRIVFPGVPYHYDNFHLSRGLTDLRRYFRNRLKTAITERDECDVQFQSKRSINYLIDKLKSHSLSAHYLQPMAKAFQYPQVIEPVVTF